MNWYKIIKVYDLNIKTYKKNIFMLVVFLTLNVFIFFNLLLSVGLEVIATFKCDWEFKFWLGNSENLLVSIDTDLSFSLYT